MLDGRQATGLSAEAASRGVETAGGGGAKGRTGLRAVQQGIEEAGWERRPCHGGSGKGQSLQASERPFRDSGSGQEGRAGGLRSV